MTVVLDVSFPFGFVHATPWGTHVNEGAVEWPLSPWRLLRGLAATWFTRCDHLDTGDVVPVLSSLANPPAVRVAPRIEASIRSYLPSEKDRTGSADRDLVIDSFAAVEPGTGVSYRWSVALDTSARSVLEELVEKLPYLGRAESVCSASVRYDDDGQRWLEPMEDGTGVGTRVLAPSVPLDFEQLCTSIRSMRKQRRLLPTGTRWVRYEVGAPMSAQPGPSRRAVPARACAARFSISSAAPLSIRHALPVGEVMRKAAMSKYGELHGGRVSEVMTGKDADGNPLTGPHAHAHWLALDIDADRLVDRVLVWAPQGFDAGELRALGEIRRLKFDHDRHGTGSVHSVAVGLESFGEPVELGLRSVVGPARVWRSATPFVPQRYWRRDREHFDDYLAACIARELAARDLPPARSIERERSTSWGAFRRQRPGEKLHKARPAYGFTVELDAAIEGPLCLGALSHFGLGRFEACPS